MALVYEAVLVVTAGVDQVLPDRPLEEAFAALTAVHPVVLPWGGKGRPSMGRQESALPSSMEGLKPTPKVKKPAAGCHLSRPDLALAALRRNSDQRQSNYRTATFL